VTAAGGNTCDAPARTGRRRSRAGTRRSSRPSTSTVTAKGHFVPWLAASGPLSYSPEAPPARDYFFQYGWVLPEIFDDRTNRRWHFYFGEGVKDRASRVFAFWQAARERAVTPVAMVVGKRTDVTIEAPVAAYACSLRGDGTVHVMMQHGSYQVLGVDHQPLLDSGEVLLYRGIQQAEVFRWLRLGTRDGASEQGRAWRRYVATQAQVLSDSTLSFNSVHDRARRTETSHIRDGTWITDDVAKENGLDLSQGTFASELWRTTHQSFTLARYLAENKFGPHFVTCKTPLANIRITTFFAGEHEVRIVDPDRVEFIECVGCRLEEVSANDL